MAHVEARAEFTAAQASGDAESLAGALLGVVNADDDAAWLQARCIELIAMEDPALRRLAVVSLGHIARLHGVAGLEVVNLLSRLTQDPAVGGAAKDALSDVHVFVERQGG